MSIGTIRWRTAISVATVGVAMFVLTACGSSEPTSTPAATTPSGGATTAPRAPATLGEPTREIEVDMFENYFDPEQITVAVGETVRIEAHNRGTAIHNLIVEAEEVEGRNFSTAILVNPGDSSDFVMSISKAGTYRFYCSFHLPDMVGTVTVE
jgi:plastocyanin